MNRWQGKVAVVTGASSGIGAVVAEDLVKAGLIVIGLARREDKLKDNQKILPKNLQSNYQPIKCDVTNEDEVKRVFNWIDEELGGTDILVNNAGVMRIGVNLTSPDNTRAICDVIDTNVKAVVFCVREAFNSMKKRNVAGHIVVLNSIFGHAVPTFPGINMYPPSKFALTAMVETYRQEFMNAGTKVKVTSISPGCVDIELIPDELKALILHLQPKDISDAILYVLGTPPHVQVHELILQAVGSEIPSTAP